MRKIVCLFAFFFLLLGCSPHSTEDFLEIPGKVELRISMPDNITPEHSERQVAFFWNKNLNFYYELRQDGKVVVKSIAPSKVFANDREALFLLDIPQEFDRTKEISISGIVKAESDIPERYTSYNGIISFDDYASIVPVDIFREDASFSLEVVTTDLRKSHNLQLSFDGLAQVFMFQNIGKDAVAYPESMTLTADSPKFSNKVITDTRRELTNSQTSITVDFPQKMRNRKLKSLEHSTFFLVLNLTSEESFPATFSVNYEKGKVIEIPKNIKIGKKENLIVFLQENIDKIELTDKLISVLKPDKGTDSDESFDFDDIEFWVGEGSKRAGVIIDWHDERVDGAMAWGYRFDGEDATGFDMLTDVIKADKRLSGIFREDPSFTVLFLLSYDLDKNKSGNVIIDDKEVPKAPDRIYFVDDYKKGSFTKYSEPSAMWKSGFSSESAGYWSYFTTRSITKKFRYSNVGISGRVLTDGAWDAWSFQTGWESMTGKKPRSKIIPAPVSTSSEN